MAKSRRNNEIEVEGRSRKSVLGYKLSSRLAQPHRSGEAKEIDACFDCDTFVTGFTEDSW
jgi:hypothetical protein